MADRLAVGAPGAWPSWPAGWSRCAGSSCASCATTAELYTRAIQPALWLLIFGETFTKLHAIQTPNGIPYLAYLAPGILAQSALFVSIFYGIQISWERDAGCWPSSW